MQHIAEGRPWTDAEVDAAVQQHVAEMAVRGHGVMMLELRATGEPVGRCGFMEWVIEGEPLLEIGWLIGPEHEGRGYATEVGAALRTHGFGELGHTTLVSVIQPENAPSIRIAEKLGGWRWRDWVTPGGADVVIYRYDRDGSSGVEIDSDIDDRRHQDHDDIVR